MKLESQKYKEAYEKEMATATYKNVNGFDCIISSNWNNESTIEEATSIANSLPYILKKEIKEIAFIIEGGASIPYWSFVFSDSDFTPVASATSIINRLTIYEPYIKEIEVYKENTIYHEAAHFYDYSHNISESEEWKNASNKDGSYPSYYAQSNQKENWAESVAYYFEDPEKFKRDFPNRTIVIERAMGINNKQNKAEDEEYYFSEIDNNN